MSINHGEVTKENSGAYAYAILPGATGTGTRAYAQNPTVEIVATDSDKHVVRDLTTGKLYANVFLPSWIGNIYAETPCSLIIKESGDGYEITVADPTQKLDEIILVFDSSVTAVSEQTEVACENGRVIIFTKKTGESYTVTVKK